MKIGLVLAGGGGKGAYELGVWKALKYLGIDKHIDIFSGTSIGAFNSILFAQDDMDIAEKLWDEVSMEKLVPISKFELMKKGVGLVIGSKNMNLAKKFVNEKADEDAVNNSGATEIIQKYLDIDKVKERNKICYAAATELPDFKIKYFRLNDYDTEIGEKMVLASASLPLIYESIEILGSRYVDGGVTDNVPIQPVYGEGCNLIIVVLLSKEGKVDRSQYPNAQIIELIPKAMDDSVINGTLNLDENAKKSRIKEGYNDTINSLKPIMDLAYYKKDKEEEEKHPFIYKIYKWMIKKLDK